MKFKVTEIDGNWVMGKFGKNSFAAKIFMGPSCFGINNGRVSKFEYMHIHYERGWDSGEDDVKVWGPLVKKLEKFAQSKRFAQQWQVRP